MVDVSKNVIDAFNENARQFALIECSKNGKVIATITEADIIQGGLKIDRCCVSGNKIEIGSAIASELSLKLQNYDGRFDDISFESSVLYVKIGIKIASKLGRFILGKSKLGIDSNDIAWIPCGRFIVDAPPRKLSTITISALDYMVKFDKPFDKADISFPIHVDDLIKKICSVCSVSLLTNVGNLPNHSFSVGSLPFSNQQLTYRQILQWCAKITGTCAYMDEEGSLHLKWFEQTNVSITSSERYSSDMLENDITITGFTYDAGDETVYLAGTSEYTLDLSDCGFLTDSQSSVLSQLYKERGGFSYRPYSATIKSAPYLFPLDVIHYKDKLGIVHETIVTNVTFGLNCNTSISGVGETLTSSSYVQQNKGITNQQTVKNRKTDSEIDEVRQKSVENSDELSDFKKNTNQTISDLDDRVGTAESDIEKNKNDVAEAAKTATNFLSYSDTEGLIIQHVSIPGKKVQVTNDSITVTDGKSSVNITSNGISITDGLGSCTIDSGNITFHGIRNTKIVDITDSETHSYGSLFFEWDLSNYSSIVLTYESNIADDWLFPGTNNTGYVSCVLPVNGEEFVISMPWNTPHFRAVTVYKNGIQFGEGKQRKSYYNLGILNSFDLETPEKSSWNTNNSVCVPKSLYGLM